MSVTYEEQRILATLLNKGMHFDRSAWKPWEKPQSQTVDYRWGIPKQLEGETTDAIGARNARAKRAREALPKRPASTR